MYDAPYPANVSALLVGVAIGLLIGRTLAERAEENRNLRRELYETQDRLYQLENPDDRDAAA